jgi:hypothetical protein
MGVEGVEQEWIHMSNPSPLAPSPDAPKSTGDPTHTASSRSGGSDRLRIVRNLLIATENNRAASENMVRAVERTTEAAQEVARVTDDADWTEDNAILGAPEGSPRSEGEFTAPRFLKPDNVPVPVSESHRVRNSLSVFGILERLVLVVSAAAITAFIIVATPPGSWNLWTNQRTADPSSANSQFPVQAVEPATMPTASPAPPWRPWGMTGGS